jgi:hypothetical protein
VARVDAEAQPDAARDSKVRITTAARFIGSLLGIFALHLLRRGTARSVGPPPTDLCYA